MSSSPAISIVGAGNWMLAHDRIGPRVLASLEGRYGAEVELCAASGLNLLGVLRAQDLVLVVDACISGAAPGSVVAVEPDLDSETVRETSIHQIGPIEALIVARYLYPEQLPRRILLLLVETEGIDAEQEVRAAERVVELLDREVAAWQLGRSAPERSVSMPREQHGGLS